MAADSAKLDPAPASAAHQSQGTVGAARPAAAAVVAAASAAPAAPDGEAPVGVTDLLEALVAAGPAGAGRSLGAIGRRVGAPVDLAALPPAGEGAAGAAVTAGLRRSLVPGGARAGSARRRRRSQATSRRPHRPRPGGDRGRPPWAGTMG